MIRSEVNVHGQGPAGGELCKHLPQHETGCSSVGREAYSNNVFFIPIAIQQLRLQWIIAAVADFTLKHCLILQHTVIKLRHYANHIRTSPTFTFSTVIRALTIFVEPFGGNHQLQQWLDPIFFFSNSQKPQPNPRTPSICAEVLFFSHSEDHLGSRDGTNSPWATTRNWTEEFPFIERGRHFFVGPSEIRGKMLYRGLIRPCPVYSPTAVNWVVSLWSFGWEDIILPWHESR